MNKEQTSMSELLGILEKSFTKIQKQLNELEGKMDKLEERMDQRFDQMDQRFVSIENRLDYHETWLMRLDKNMVTKSQFNKLLNILEKNKVISSFDTLNIAYPTPVG